MTWILDIISLSKTYFPNSGFVAEFNLVSLLINSFPLAPQSTMAVWLPSGALQPCNHTWVDMCPWYWLCLSYSPQSPLSLKVNQWISIYLGGGRKQPSNYKYNTHRALLTWTYKSSLLTMERTVPYKHKMWSFILSLGLRSRVIS